MQITPQQFAQRVGQYATQWTATASGAQATFDTGSFAQGVKLVTKIGELADAADHHPDVELTYPSVTVHLVTHDDGDVLTDKDADLAAKISQVAGALD